MTAPGEVSMRRAFSGVSIILLFALLPLGVLAEDPAKPARAREAGSR